VYDLADTRVTAMLNKVPEVTLTFWVIKITSTTVGETGADYLAVHVGLGTALTGAAAAITRAIELTYASRPMNCSICSSDHSSLRMRRSRVAVMPSSRMASPTRQSLGVRARAPRIATGRRPQDRPNPGNTDKVVLCLTISLRAWGGRRREYNHATSFCSGVSGRLCRWVYSWICTWRLCARCWLCPRIWSWRLCARSYDSLSATEPAGAV
jgi:Repeat of Unknown Function (DUF347)